MALLAPVAAHADPVARWRPLISDAARRFGMPVAWIERVMRVESDGFDVVDGQPTTSRAGAMGLMQLMPSTWRAMRDRIGLGSNPYDPRDNILAGTLYLRLMYDRFGYPGLFAAYNAGPGRYGDYLAGRAGLPDETRAYLASLAHQSVRQAQTTPPSDPMFFVRHGRATIAGSAPAPLFIGLSAATPANATK